MRSLYARLSFLLVRAGDKILVSKWDYRNVFVFVEMRKKLDMSFTHVIASPEFCIRNVFRRERNFLDYDDDHNCVIVV